MSALVDRVEHLSRTSPDRCVLESPQGDLSYRQLSERSAALARQLAACGAPGCTVAVIGGHTGLHLLALLACQRIGWVYMPLDASGPRPRSSAILDEARPACILLSELVAQSLAWLQDTGIPVLTVDPVLATMASTAAATVAHCDPSVGPAYIIYTSGSTGRPKGVVVGRSSLDGLVQTADDFFDLARPQRVLGFFPPQFDGALLDVATVVASGGILVLPSTLEREAGPRLATFCRSRRITFAVLTPSALAQIPMSPRISQLETLCVAGERCPDDLAMRWGSQYRLYNLYGLTETTVWSLGTRLDPKTIGGEIPVGCPVGTATASIRGQDLQPVMAGEEGELCIGGGGLAIGYLDDPELTSSRFIEAPGSGERLLRTGDRGRFDSAGRVVIIGRMDRQLKLRGNRVEPAEVEAELERHPEVIQAVVIAHPTPAGVLNLCAFYTGNAAPEIVRRHARHRLPAAMMPAVLRQLDALPVTATGKVDLALLPSPWQAEAARARRFRDSPVLDIIESVLSCRVAPGARLIEAGMDSLAAARIAARLESMLGVEIEAADIFELGTAAALAKRVEGSTAHRRQPPLRVADSDDARGLLTAAQERVWAHQVLESESKAYNAVGVVHLRGGLDLDRFRAALEDLVQRHGALRTRIRVDGEGPWQEVLADLPRGLPLSVIDLRDRPRAHRPLLTQRVAYHAATRFDLGEAPLLRWELIRLTDDRHTLIHAEHHLIHDGWSFQVLLEDLMALYDFRSGRGPDLQDQPEQLADVARRERLWRCSESAVLQRAWWREQLWDLPLETTFPGERQRPAVPSRLGARVMTEIPSPVMDALGAAARAEETTELTLLFTCFAVLLRRFVDRSDLCIGIATANRRTVADEQVIGMVINSVPVRLDLEPEQSDSEVIRTVHQALLEASRRQELPFQDVVAASEVSPDPSRNPLFQVMFGYHAPPRLRTRPVALEPEVEIAWPGNSAKLDLTAIAIPARSRHLSPETQGPCTVIWEYSTDLFDSDFVEHLGRCFERLTRRIGRSAKSALLGDPLPPLAIARGSTIVEEPRLMVLDCLLDRCRADSDVRALKTTDRELTYRQLAEDSHGCARRLQSHGVLGDDVVAVLSSRADRLVTAALGSWRIGAAYLLLDPTHPRRRIQEILASADVRCVAADHELLDLVPEGIASVDLDGRSAAGDPLRESRADRAYVVATSGSTGPPRAVEVSHDALANLVSWHLRVYPVASGDPVSQAASPGFDAWAWEVWPALCSGATLCFLPAAMRTDPHAVVGWLASEDIRSAFLPTGLAQAVLALPAARSLGLHRLLVGGDRWTLGLPDLPFEVINHYGLTETAVVATAGPLHPEAAPDIGRPVDNARVHVVDASGKPVPIGAVGEIVVAGAAMALRYRNTDQGAKTGFRQDPLASGATAFFTGDYGRMREDGSIVYVGRRDEQHKIRGHRVELGEVEQALASHPAVRQTVAWTTVAADGSKVLHAGYVATGTLTSEHLVIHLRDRLPAAICPAHLARLQEIPLTANGKVDRTALQNLKPVISDVPTGAPTSSLERWLLEVWSGLLGTDVQDSDANFFALGGDSLKLAHLKYRIHEDLEVEVSMHTLFTCATVSALATRLGSAVPRVKSTMAGG